MGQWGNEAMRQWGNEPMGQWGNAAHSTMPAMTKPSFTGFRQLIAQLPHFPNSGLSLSVTNLPVPPPSK
jgi:hypothetical protein